MRVVFIGTGEIGLPVLRWMLASQAHELAGVVTQPDKPAGRDQRLHAPAIKTALSGLPIPVLQPQRIKRAEAVAEIRALHPDVIVVMAYGQILPTDVLEIPTTACLNLHASLLPKYRGAAPIQAAIASGDRETGITVMYMDAGLDTGDILLKSTIPISSHDTGGSLHDRLGEIAPAALAEALASLESGTAPRLPQNNHDATYAPKLGRDDGRLDWSEPAAVIERKIRAFNPWPGAYAFFKDDSGRGRKLKIFGATLMDETFPEPGKLISSSTNGVLIATGNASLQLREVQLEGKKRMDAAALVRGHPWLVSAASG
jgi:methionyl-tRNA formyltransferase